MKSSGRAQKTVHWTLGVMALASILLGSLAACTPGKPPTPAGPSPTTSERDFQKEMTQVPLPKKGCFKATYPTREWHEVPCTTAPTYPMPPHNGLRPDIVGSTNDVSPQVPTGFISTANGSFGTVTGETDTP